MRKNIRLIRRPWEEEGRKGRNETTSVELLFQSAIPSWTPRFSLVKRKRVINGCVRECIVGSRGGLAAGNEREEKRRKNQRERETSIYREKEREIERKREEERERERERERYPGYTGGKPNIFSLLAFSQHSARRKNSTR